MLKACYSRDSAAELIRKIIIEPIEALQDTLLHVGDMHAVQGDSEICGAGGIEASGPVRLQVELRHKKSGHGRE